MFPFDQAALPQLTTRKAFIAVDFQNDFVSPDGALPAAQPEGFVGRAATLANAFRAAGDVIWVQSRFQQTRPADPDKIIASDAPPPPQPKRGRRRAAAAAVPEPTGPIDPEAFLSHDQPSCLKPDSTGCDMPDEIKAAVAKGDAILTKSHYSAFDDTQLLRVLRAKMVMEVVICGSLINIGVYATAMDAATHGMSITVVDDCCGKRSDVRQTRTIDSLEELTGCEFASCDEILKTLGPPKPLPVSKPPRAAGTISKPSPRAEPTPATAPAKDTKKIPSSSSDLIDQMTNLRLAPELEPASPAISAPAKDTAKAPPKAECAYAAEDADAANLSTKADSDSQGSTAPSKFHEASREVETDEKPVLELKDGIKDSSSTIDKKGSHSTVDATAEDEQAIPTTPPSSLPPSSPLSPRSEQPLSEVMDKLTISDPPSSAPKLSDGMPPPPPQTQLCEGDTDIIQDLLPPTLEAGIFDKLRDEIRWQRMSHQGGDVPRLVAVQGAVADNGDIPVYRHPADESPPLLPFSPTVLAIKAETEKRLGHPLNHVLIQFYRDGNDYISEHSDKTLDIVRDSYIANVSLGAERTMVLRTKRLDKDHSAPKASPAPSSTAQEQAKSQEEQDKPNAQEEQKQPDPQQKERKEPASPEEPKRKIQRARLPHNSLCKMGLRTNMKWLHSIRQDKRAPRDKTPAETAYNGGRISLTFRQIGTFLDASETLIWGQGATAKTREEAQPVVNGQGEQAVRMLRAFGTENHASVFEWDGVYGGGFDVLHMSSSPRLFASGDAVVNMRVGLMLAELGVGHAKGRATPTSTSPPATADAEASSIKFIDTDEAKSVVTGDAAILLYLDACRTPKSADPPTPVPQSELARRFTRLQQGLSLLPTWRRLSKESATPKAIKSLLAPWEAYAAETIEEAPFVAVSATPSVADFAFWPVLHDIVEKSGDDAVDVFDGLEKLRAYYEMFGKRDSAKKVLGGNVASEKSM